MMKSKFKYLAWLTTYFYFANCASIINKLGDNVSVTTVKARNVTSGTIDLKLVEKPHHLFVGRCKPDERVLHQENVVLENDGKSQIAAAIRINVEGPVNITCVKIYDEVPNGEGGYPSFVGGGVGYNYVEFNILTDYGKGFHFYVQIYGNTIRTSTTTSTSSDEEEDMPKAKKNFEKFSFTKRKNPLNKYF